MPKGIAVTRMIAEVLEAREHVVEGRDRQREAEVGEGRRTARRGSCRAIGRPSSAAPQATSMPKAMATSPAGMPRG